MVPFSSAAVAFGDNARGPVEWVRSRSPRCYPSQKARNLERDPRLAISVAGHHGHGAWPVAERLDGPEAWAIIDRTDRVVFLVEVEHARAQTFG